MAPGTNGGGGGMFNAGAEGIFDAPEMFTDSPGWLGVLGLTLGKLGVADIGG
jgi:hypothetical protein